jgi:hypothetical protein
MLQYSIDLQDYNIKSKAISEQFRAALAKEYGEAVGTKREAYIWEKASQEDNWQELEYKYEELSDVPVV